MQKEKKPQSMEKTLSTLSSSAPTEFAVTPIPRAILQLKICCHPEAVHTAAASHLAWPLPLSKRAPNSSLRDALVIPPSPED